MMGDRDMTNDPRELMLEAAEQIKSNLAKRVDTSALAREAGYSKFHFIRLFHKHVGYAPGHFQSLCRDEWAMWLLRETDLSVMEIVYTVGYSSTGTFSRKFKRRYGMKMASYRDMMRHFDSIRKADAVDPPTP